MDVLEQDAFDILQLIRSWRNRVAPVNRIPPEILALIPDFLDVDGRGKRDENIIALTHVCRAWRGVFVSRPTLWTDLDYADGSDKTRVYLERSKPFPINLKLNGDDADLPDFFKSIPGITGRFKSLDVRVNREDLQVITPYLSHPAPFLEVLSICGRRDPVLESTLFDGDLSLLRELQLKHVRTELPWRNMINLTSFTVHSEVSVGHLLDFFEGAPHLRTVWIRTATSTNPDAWDGRLVPLSHLQWMGTMDYYSSLLFDHLSIPVGAELHMTVDLHSPTTGDPPPRFIDNLKNLTDFTAIKLNNGPGSIRFSGPNGEVSMRTPETWTTASPEFLTHFDTSKTKRLEILGRRQSLTSDSVYRTLLPMKDLRTLKFDRHNDAQTLHALHPDMSSSGVIVCPELEELIIVHWRGVDIKNVAATVAARASRGANLKSVEIVSLNGTVHSQLDVLELTKHVPDAERDL